MSAQDKPNSKKYGTLRREILKCLRGKKSQDEVSQELGFKHNQVYRWESGRTKFLWQDFSVFCHVTKADIEGALRKSVHFFGDPSYFSQIANHLVGSADHVSIAKITGFSRHKIRRWTNGETSASLDDFLCLIDKLNASANLFSSHIKNSYPDHLQEKTSPSFNEVIAQYPESMIVDIILMQSEYKALQTHPKGYIAKALGISESREEELLQAMCESGMLLYSKCKYHPATPQHVNTTPPTFDEHADIIQYWSERFLAAQDRHRGKDFDNGMPLASYRALYVSQEISEEIRKKCIDFYREIGLILRKKTKGEPSELHVMLLHFFRPVHGMQAKGLARAPTPYLTRS